MSAKNETATNQLQENSAAAKKEQKRLAAEKRKALQPLSDRVKRAERVIEKLDVEKNAIEVKLADTNLYNEDNKEQLKQLLTDQAYIQKELDQAETDWMEASESLEQAQKTN